MARPFCVRRALLYMPGSDLRKNEKAATLGVDSACLDLEDGVAAGRKAEARGGVQLGFTGMQIIHLNQVAPVQEVFTPDDEQIAQAVRVVDAFRAHLKKRQSGWKDRLIEIKPIEPH